MGNITRLSDYSIALESFKGSERETNPLYRDYHGKNTHIHTHTLTHLPLRLCHHTHTHTHPQCRCIKAGAGPWIEAGQPPRRPGCHCTLVCSCSIRRAPQQTGRGGFSCHAVPSPSPSIAASLQDSLTLSPSISHLTLPALPPHPISHPQSHTPEALEQSTPTLRGIDILTITLPLSASISLSLAQCLRGQHAPLINGETGFEEVKRTLVWG